MEKDSKYYEVIENLVRNHKKFNGYEAILDEIIDDVYSHSEVILNTVANEQVVHSYLEKVVSTSIITVPQKLNFNKEVKHAIINPSIPTFKEKDNEIVQNQDNLEEQLNNTDEIALNIEPEQEITTDLTKKVNELVEHEEEIEMETANSDALSLELEITEDEPATQDFEPIKQLKKESAVQDFEPIEQLQEVLSIDVETSSNFIKVDNDLVDKMINLPETAVDNSVNTDEQSFEIKNAPEVILESDELDYTEPETFELDGIKAIDTGLEVVDFQESEEEPSENFVVDSSNELLEAVDETNDENIVEVKEILTDENTIELELTEETRPVDINVDDITFVSDDSLYSAESTSEDSLNFDPSDNLQELEITNTELDEPEINMLENSSEDTEEESFNFEIVPELHNEDINDINFEDAPLDSINTEDLFENSNSLEVIDTIDTVEEFKPVEFESESSSDLTNLTEEIGTSEELLQDANYDLYSQITADLKCKNLEYNKEEISDNISRIVLETPNIDLAKLFELKFKQNKNVDEIASELNSSTEEVIEGLNKLISVL